jgi:phage terminase large subunit
MSTTVTSATERISLPAVLRFYDHQREAIQAFHEGAKRAIWRWHRQGGKGQGALGWTGMEAFARPGTYMIASPTASLGGENFWDAIDPDSGRRYIDLVFPPQIVLDTNENEKAIIIATAEAGKTSRIIFRSADDPDRLRGPAYAGVVLDEFSTMPGREPLDIVRIPVERAGGWLLITSTPKGMNHFYEVWKNAEQAGGWYLSTKTITDTHRHDGSPIISLAQVEQERAEGQAEAWIQQEYFVAFTAALVSSYYGDLLTRAEAEGRILDLPHRPDARVVTGWDLGYRDATVIVYAQERGEWLDVFDCDGFEGMSLPEILSRMDAHRYGYREHLAPHDIGQHEFGSGQTPLEVARRLGVAFRVAPKLDVQSGIDAVRRLFGRLRFDRRRCAKLLEALAGYEKIWDAKGKVFRDKPLHSWHSHYADALRTLATAYKPPRPRDGQPPAKSKTYFNVFARPDTW